MAFRRTASTTSASLSPRVRRMGWRYLRSQIASCRRDDKISSSLSLAAVRLSWINSTGIETIYRTTYQAIFPFSINKNRPVLPASLDMIAVQFAYL